MSEKYHENTNGDELSDVVELVGEKGSVLKFYHIGTIEYKDEWYAFFQPSEPLEGVDPDEIVIFKISDNGGDEVLLPIEDEALLDEVYEEFMRELAEDDEGCDGNCEGCKGCNGND